MQRYGYDLDLRRSGRSRPARSRDALDPNYQGDGYRGTRMRGEGEWQAPYGRHRLRHSDDLGGYGGYRGLYSRDSAFLLGGPAGHGQELYPIRNRDYGRDFLPWRGTISGYDAAYRDFRTPPLRIRSRNSARARGYGDEFNSYGGYNSGGFSEGR